MKHGLTLSELAQEIERQARVKKDYHVKTAVLRVTPDANGVLAAGNRLASGINQVAHRQIGEAVGIPAKYYDRMVEKAPALLATNVNHWFEKEPETKLVRTLDNRARALLSDKFRPLDNVDLAEAVLPVLQKFNLDIMSCAITEQRLYLKAVDPAVKKQMPAGTSWGKGHTVFRALSPGIVISNSEVGMGSVAVETAVWDEVCTNLAIFKQRSVRKYHMGARADLGEDVYAMLSNKTKALTDAALWSQIGDVVSAAFDRAKFDALTDEIADLRGEKLEGDPVKVVELTAKRFSMTEAEGKSVLRHLIAGGDLSRFGLFNAVTRTAEDLDSYDRATEFERLGGQIVELKRTEWEELAEAA